MSAGRARHGVRALLVAIAVTVAAGPTEAQTADEDGPEGGAPRVIDPLPDLVPFRLLEFDTALELEWRRDVDEVDPRDGGTRRTRQDRLREILDLRTTGFIGHPNLIELDLGGRVWLEQRWIEATGNDTERIGQTLGEWDVSGLILKESNLPLTLYSRQSVSDIDRDFGGTISNTFRETGLRLSLRDDVIPTSLHVYRRRIDQDDRFRQRDFTLDQDTIQADGRVEMSSAHRMAWDVKYDDIDEAGDLRTTRSVERFETNATHTVQFGPTERHQLRTRVRLFDETGDRQLRQVRVDPRLRLRHADNLQSWYDYSYARDDRSVQQQTSHRATANFQHDLFESLTTIGTAGFEMLTIPTEDFDSDEIFGRLDVEYRKQVPYGRLTLGLQAAQSRLEQSDRGASIAFADQRLVFDGANFIVINGRNVDARTIVVTDATGTIVYNEGIDYVVREFANQVEIQRLPGGNLAPGQAVSVDYVLGPEPGARTDTSGLGADARYTIDEGALRGLSFYADYFQQHERRTGGVGDFPDDDFRDTRYGVEYNAGKVFLRAEGQKRTGELSPFDAVRLEGRYVEPLGGGSSVVVGALYQELDRSLDDIRTTTTTFTGQWNQRIAAQLRLSLIARYQLTDDTRNFESEAFEQQLDLVWRRGQTEVYAQVRNSITDTNADDTILQRFIVGVRREF